MGTKRQETFKKAIFQNTKRTRTTADINPDLDLSLLEHLGIKFKKDESKDYFRKTSKEIKLLTEAKQKLEEEHKVTTREKKAYIITMMENLTDAQINDLYKQVEGLVGDSGTV